MELYQLRTFVAVADEGHLTRAAERLFISQPAVSAHIKALEEELGVALFMRTPKGMILTGPGELLKSKAEQTLVMAGDFLSQARLLRSEAAGRVRLALNTDSAYLRVPDIMRNLRERSPKVELHVLQSMSWQIQDGVAAGTLEAGFCFGPSRREDLLCVRLHTFNLVVVAPPDWQERIEGASLEDLARMPFVWVDCQCPFLEALNGLFCRNGFEPCKAAVADHEEGLRSLVAAGVGLSLLREDEALKASRAGLVAIWQGESVPMDLSFVCRKTRAEDPLIRAVLDSVLRAWPADPEQEP